MQQAVVSHALECLGTSFLPGLDPPLCPLWGSISTVSGDCGSRGGGSTQEPERAVKSGVIAGEVPLRH